MQAGTYNHDLKDNISQTDLKVPLLSRCQPLQPQASGAERVPRRRDDSLPLHHTTPEAAGHDPQDLDESGQRPALHINQAQKHTHIDLDQRPQTLFPFLIPL